MVERREITIGGIVQGVGFRPFIYGLAVQYGLAGLVRNVGGQLLIEVEGEVSRLEQFLQDLSAQPPPLARIDRLTWRRMPAVGSRCFCIEASQTDHESEILISPDVAPCAACLAELLDPADRRFQYPFLNCTNCGPRLTIIMGAPYDRSRTTMAEFPMCPQCRAEYDHPANRRFHAQPTACATCGPRLELRLPSGDVIECDDPVAAFAEAVNEGQIGAMKGLGGYHLVCNARNEAAVLKLRERKHRDEKPFALMIGDVAAAEAICEINAEERQLLESCRAPIVLLRRRSSSEDVVADAVAPGNPYLGVMLPSTPLHHLLLRQVNGIPLVMTSGNRSDEPIAYIDDDAFERLREIADLFLTHNRPIHVRCDDSVTRLVAGAELPLRRSRGYAPQPIMLPHNCPFPLLAVGGQLKGTFALGRGKQAIVSHHLGDLDHYDAYRAFEKDVALYERLFDIRPECIVHDLHPDYASTRYATASSEPHAAVSGPFPRRSLRDGRGYTIGVQHHHAHMAACMVEHRLTGSVIGVTFDGTGLGTDGAIWGGEFLVGGYQQFRRAAHLRYIGLPGGDRAVKQPWRMAAAHLIDAGLESTILQSRVSPRELRTLETMLRKQVNCPWTSSMGRLFDAVAALVGLRDHVSYEGQAAMELEWLAGESEPQKPYRWEMDERSVHEESPAADPPAWMIDTRPLIRSVVEDIRSGFDGHVIARRFHATVTDMIAVVCGRIRAETGLNRVVLSGGVFMNALLTEETTRRLGDEQFNVYRHRLVPPNDGGLSLGQIAIAAALLGAEGTPLSEPAALADRAFIPSRRVTCDRTLDSQPVLEGCIS